MKVHELIALRRPTFSFEFFPPKAPSGEIALFKVIDDLKRLSPSFISVTYGAGGASRAKTIEWVRRIRLDIGIETLAHLTCVGASRAELQETLKDLAVAGIENALLLRGDPPAGEAEFRPPADGFRYASELIAFARELIPDLSIGAACYPEKHVECLSPERDLDHLVHKVQQGVDFLITQLFFDNEHYFAFLERARAVGITVPILAGIMPITNYDQVQRFTQMCGAVIPAALQERLAQVCDDKDEVRKIGVAHATEQCLQLLDRGVPGIHFYTLNRSTATQEIYRNLLRLRTSSQGGSSPSMSSGAR